MLKTIQNWELGRTVGVLKEAINNLAEGTDSVKPTQSININT